MCGSHEELWDAVYELGRRLNALEKTSTNGKGVLMTDAQRFNFGELVHKANIGTASAARIAANGFTVDDFARELAIASNDPKVINPKALVISQLMQGITTPPKE